MIHIVQLYKMILSVPYKWTGSITFFVCKTDKV